MPQQVTSRWDLFKYERITGGAVTKENLYGGIAHTNLESQDSQGTWYHKHSSF